MYWRPHGEEGQRSLNGSVSVLGARVDVRARKSGSLAASARCACEREGQGRAGEERGDVGGDRFRFHSYDCGDGESRRDAIRSG